MRTKTAHIGMFLAKKDRKTTAEEEESTTSKRQRRKTLKGESCCLLMERGPPQCYDPSPTTTSNSIHVHRHAATQHVFNHNYVNYYTLLLSFTLLYVHCILICLINTPRFQLMHNRIHVSRHSLELINRLLTISYLKYCLTFRTNQLSTSILRRITFDIRGFTVQP